MNKVQIRRLIKNLPPTRVGWQDYASCMGEDANEFVYSADYPSKKTRDRLSVICSNCRVLETCRYEAVRNQEVGWWGGMDEKERMKWASEVLFNQQ